ncbi:MAG: hypothetical protein IPL79_03000 [Myxococcales bacterium]|nr:hypothetical protein [Myxococcales bacterium]
MSLVPSVPTADPIEPRELVLRFLSSIGRPNEAEQYLKLFRAEPEQFAAIHVSDNVAKDALLALVVDLRFLAQLNLFPVLVFGAMGTKTAGRTLERVRAVLEREVPCDVVTAKDARHHIRRERVPMIALEDGRDPEGFDALAELVTELRTRRVVFLSSRSGLMPRGGGVVSMVNLTTEKDALIPRLPPAQAELVRQVDRLIATVPQALTVSVTSPLDLLRELFTVKGAGTMLRRGSIVQRFSDWRELDGDRLVTLVEAAFGKTLAPGFRDRGFERAYVADVYRGAAVVTRTALGPYLSKFAVTLEARGEGVGGDLWRVLSQDYEQLFWRSRMNNPITAWYREQADGWHKMVVGDVHWAVLWRGFAPRALPDLIEYCQQTPPDFVT